MNYTTNRATAVGSCVCIIHVTRVRNCRNKIVSPQTIAAATANTNHLELLRFSWVSSMKNNSAEDTATYQYMVRPAWGVCQLGGL